MKKSFIPVVCFLLTVICCCRDEPDSDAIIQRNDSCVVLTIDLSGSLQNPAFAPDGRAIVFTRFQNGYNEEPSDLFIYNLQTGQLKTLVSDGSGNVNLTGSVWNDSINAIVFSSSRDPHDEIFIIQENGTPGSEIKITNRQDSVAYEPSLDPNGEWVVFESHKLDEEDNGIIIKFRIDGTSPYIRLTPPADDCRQPNWSPAGDKIVYQKYAAGKWDIWTMSADGTGKFKVTSGEGDKTDACFSHDGQHLIYSSDSESDLANIYIIPATGGTSVRLTNYGGYDGAPSISPDGKTLVFESSPGDPDGSEGTRLYIKK